MSVFLKKYKYIGNITQNKLYTDILHDYYLLSDVKLRTNILLNRPLSYV